VSSEGIRVGVMSAQMMDPLLPVAGIAADARAMEARGFASYWLPNVFNFDAITALALAGAATHRIELATAVVPTPSRQPIAMAQQALTAQAACGGRFTLGIGLSHQVVTEGMWGLSYSKPARQMREYLEALQPLLAGERADVDGEFYRVRTRVDVPDRRPVPVLVAAMGERMLRVAGRLADGTIPWLAGPRTLEGHIVPGIREAARAAGRPAPRIVSALPVALSRDGAGARKVIHDFFALYSTVPSYRRMLEREGAASPAEVALVGDESALGRAIDRLAECGATDLVAVCVPVDPGAVERTLGFLAHRAAN
jgi:5,10-methylenetetrahydromethanopterin reductase